MRPAQPLANVSSIPQASGSGTLEENPNDHKITTSDFRYQEDVDEFEISLADLHRGPRIGHGSFGVVYRGTWLETDVAIKELIVQNLYEDSDLQEVLLSTILFNIVMHF